MNIVYMKYAVEVARLGSVNKAAESMLTAQPNISRAIRELEADLEITIFKRTPKGMIPTAEGEEFLRYAQRILEQMDDIEKMFKERIAVTLRCSICAPRASYISTAFTDFTRRIGDVPAEIYYNETNSAQTIKNVAAHEYDLGVIRYAADYDKYFKEVLIEKRLYCEPIAEFRYVIAVSRQSKLAKLPRIKMRQLDNYFEVAHSDLFVPSLPHSLVMHNELYDNIKRRIFVFERGSQLEVLADNPDTFMWVSPISDSTLDRFGLVQKICVDNTRSYQDMLIYRKDYTLTELDKEFISELSEAKRKYLDGFFNQK